MSVKVEENDTIYNSEYIHGLKQVSKPLCEYRVYHKAYNFHINNTTMTRLSQTNRSSWTTYFVYNVTKKKTSHENIIGKLIYECKGTNINGE